MADSKLFPALDDALANLKPEQGGVRRLLFQEVRRFAVEDCRCTPCRHGAPEAATPAAGETGNNQDASRLFDVVWAQQVITTSLARMKMHCQNENKMDLWTLFDQRLCIPILADKSPAPYRILVERLGIKSPAHAHQLLSAGKQMFSDFLSGAIAEYESNTARINREKSELHSILAQS